MAFGRRKFLVGIGGVAVGLPFFEGLAAKDAKAATGAPPFAIFYRRGNGVQQAIYDRNSWPSSTMPGTYWTQKVPPEKERWWPVQADGVTPIPFGDLELGTVSALSTLEAYKARMTVVKGLRHPYGTENGHPEGAIQGLTGAGVKYYQTRDKPDIAGCYPLGESLDNRIAAELSNNAQKTSLYMGFQTRTDNFISWQKAGATSLVARTATENLKSIFNDLFSTFTLTAAQEAAQKAQTKTVNDLVRSDLKRLQADPRMSKADLDLLDLHMTSIHDLENAVGACDPAKVNALGTDVGAYDVNAAAKSSISQSIGIMARLSAMAVACGVRQSILINVGFHQDTLGYGEVSPIPTVGQYPFHAISHRLTQDGDGSPALAAGSDYHHSIDIYHLQQFQMILAELDKYPGGVGGQTLLDRGVCVHYSDLGSGQHINSLLPYFYVGSAAKNLVVGKYINADREYLVKFLNTIGAAVGVKNSAGNGPLDDFNSKDGILPPGSIDSDGGLTPAAGGVRPNNNYLSHNYTRTNYWQDTPTTFQEPADGKMPITGRLPALIGPGEP